MGKEELISFPDQIILGTPTSRIFMYFMSRSTTLEAENDILR